MTRKPMDGASFALIVQLLDAAEEWLVIHTRCKPNEASDVVTLRYIYWAAGMIAGASLYLPSDEGMGARFFLQELPGAKTAFRSVKRLQSCTELLATQPHRFLPHFEDILRALFKKGLETTANKWALRNNGVSLLAAAALPEYRTELRREMRLRSLNEDFEPLLVTDRHLALRVNDPSRFDRLISDFRGISTNTGTERLDD